MPNTCGEPRAETVGDLGRFRATQIVAEKQGGTPVHFDIDFFPKRKISIFLDLAWLEHDQLQLYFLRSPRNTVASKIGKNFSKWCISNVHKQLLTGLFLSVLRTGRNTDVRIQAQPHSIGHLRESPCMNAWRRATRGRHGHPVAPSKTIGHGFFGRSPIVTINLDLSCSVQVLITASRL